MATFSICVVVFYNFFCSRQVLPGSKLLNFSQLLLKKRFGRIVGTKYLGGQPIHELLQVLIQHCRVYFVENFRSVDFFPLQNRLKFSHTGFTHSVVLVVDG
jgi:hypothetical protein